MTRRMLINARSREEVRIAVLADTTLENYQVEVAESGLTRGNIYRGQIANLQSALDAAFVDYGAAKNGFLTLQDVVPEARYKEPKGSGRPRIDQVLEKGKPIVVQVERDPEGQKGAILTTNLSFAGRYLVLTPFDGTRGVSRKVSDDDTRGRLKEIVGKLELPDGCGVIVRTNALDQTRAELQRDLAALLRVWKRVQQEVTVGKGPKLLYSDQDILLRALRDHLDTSVEEVLVDDDDVFERAQQYMQAFMPRSKTELIRYEERVPLFSKFALESQIERIFRRSVQLASGGAIVIDPTEALTAIDVNSGRSSGKGSHEEMALRTNLEAAREAVRQLRLRDLGGLVVVDFIDMRQQKNRRAVEKAVKDELKHDRARSSVGRISPNGLLEINRQKVQQSLSSRAHRPCPTCAGTGRVPSIEAMGLNLIRRIEGRAATGRLMKARIELQHELAEAVQNGRRGDLARLEQEYGIEIEIVATHRILGPEEQIEWRDRPSNGAPQLLRPVEPVQRKSAPVVFEIAPVDEGEEEATPTGDGETKGGERKRRRRGGRRRKKKNGNGDSIASERAARSDADEPVDEAGSEPDEAGEATAEGTADGENGSRPRRRRRGGRRRGGRKHQKGAAGENGTASAGDGAGEDRSPEPADEPREPSSPEPAPEAHDAAPQPEGERPADSAPAGPLFES